MTWQPPMIDQPRLGDIILYGGSRHEAMASRLIEAGELLVTGDDRGVQYSHVGLWESHQIQLESTWPRIRRSRIDMSRCFDILRYDGITEDQRRVIMSAAAQRLGEPYNLLYIVTGGLAYAKITGTEVCCLYAGDCYAVGKIHLRYATPNDLRYKSPLRVIQQWRPA